MTANDFDEPKEMGHDVASLEKGSILDDFTVCMRNQIYNGSSCHAVVCRCCGAEETSGSWRRGWKVRAILDDTSVQPLSDETVANLCNRCGQRWAKMGKLETEGLKSVMTCFVHATTHKARSPLAGVHRKRRRSSGSLENRIRKYSPQGDAQYIGYTTTRVPGDKSCYALFWVMDKMAQCTLVAIGVDARSSGHFIYTKSPLVSPSLPTLYCTNRSETFKWIQDNFHVKNPLAASLKAHVPEVPAEQVEKILRGEKQHVDIPDPEKEAQQHLCATCGCNHPSEECPAVIEPIPGGTGVVLNNNDHDHDLSDPFGPTSPIPTYFDLEHDVPDLHDGISPLGDHIFASPKDYTPRSGEVFAGPQHCDSPEALLTNIDIVGQKTQNNIQQMPPHDIMIRTINTDTQVFHSTLKAWTKTLEDFVTGKAHTSTQHVLLVLQQLLTCDTLSLHDLSESRILIPVSQLCTHGHPMIASTSRQLADIWRSLAVTTIHNNSSTIM